MQLQKNETQHTSNEVLFNPKLLTNKQLEDFLTKISNETAILGSRLNAVNLQKLIDQKLFTGILNSEFELIASAMLWPVDSNSNWYEMGTVWVDANQRGQGLGHKVFDDITSKIPEGKSTFLLTKSPKVIHSATTFGYLPLTIEEFEKHQFAINPPAELEEKLFAIIQTRINNTSKQLLTLRNS